MQGSDNFITCFFKEQEDSFLKKPFLSYEKKIHPHSVFLVISADEVIGIKIAS